MEPTIPTPRHTIRETRAAAKRRETREANEGALAQQPVGATKVHFLADQIHSANTQFGKQFTGWVMVVGSNLKEAQATLASHKLGFEKWCKQEFGWDARHVRRIIEAREMIGLIGPIGPVETLPTSEAQCRELSSVPKDKVAEVWTEVVKKAESDGTQITAKLIRNLAEKYVAKDGVENDQPVSSGFDENRAGDRLRDWLRAELDKWPEKHRPEAAHWIRQILQEEFRL